MKGILIWKIQCGFKVLVSLTKEKLWEIIKRIKNKHIEQRQQRNLLGDGVGGRIHWESVTTANSDIGNTIWKYITFCLSRKNFSLIDSFVLLFLFFFGLFYIFSSKKLQYRGYIVQNTNGSFSKPYLLKSRVIRSNVL